MTPQDSYMVVSNPVSIEYGDFNVLFTGESQTKPGHSIGPKVYDFYLLHHILSGRGTFTVQGNQYPLHAGHSFLIEPEQLVQYAADEDEPWRYRWVAFAGSRCSELVSSVGLANGRLVVDSQDNRRIASYIKRIRHTFRSRGPFAHLQAQGLLQLILAELGEALRLPDDQPDYAGEEGSALVQQVIRYLSTQYAEPVSIERMAETIGFNRAYLSRAFKRHTGMSPVTFLLRLRIDKARRLLRERQELTVEQIAASVGFQDPLYFSKQFRRIYGQPPTSYREEMRQL
ncbi:AraC family transcriptional regulator [Paenibacillus tarimensis]|uniref:AraC family transcriptional regulator n=1 Tax=Paenibacillus tarimensis TaxID=416012 RepID=UPI001F3EC692|nr:AraC family transcriptional regulator [Paenibacillus tarimensis]MCF2943645.1 AraC family transcriptional regulator [Paenibacillus tarimensis]